MNPSLYIQSFNYELRDEVTGASRDGTTITVPELDSQEAVKLGMYMPRILALGARDRRIRSSRSASGLHETMSKNKICGAEGMTE